MRTQLAMSAFRAASYPCTRLVWHRQHVGDCRDAGIFFSDPFTIKGHLWRMSYGFSTFLFVTFCSQSCILDTPKDQENDGIWRTKKCREIREVMGEQAPSTSDSVCTKSLQLLFSSLHKADDPKPCCKHSKALSSCSKYLNLMVSPTISFT